MPVKALLTGGLGFIGFNFFELFKNECEFLVVDKRSYASNPEAEARIENVRIMDIGSPEVFSVLEQFQPEVIFNFAAESHVDRSIMDPTAFLKSNVYGTLNLLEATRLYQERFPQKKIRFVQISTDEVYGSLGREGLFSETTPMQPNSPYSASKASADCFVRAYHHTYKVDTITTRCSNNYGPWQFPEKLIPLMISNALENKPLPVYGTGENVRDWIYVNDHCLGIMAATRAGRSGEVYNFGGAAERSNLHVVKTILAALGKPETLIQYVTDRKGHDFRYAIDWSKSAKELAWRPQTHFEDGLTQTITWNLEHREWLSFLKSADFKTYYQRNYEQRAPA